MLEKARAEFLGVRRAHNYQIERDVFEKKKYSYPLFNGFPKKTFQKLSTFCTDIKSLGVLLGWYQRGISACKRYH